MQLKKVYKNTIEDSIENVESIRKYRRKAPKYNHYSDAINFVYYFIFSFPKPNPRISFRNENSSQKSEPNAQFALLYSFLSFYQEYLVK